MPALWHEQAPPYGGCWCEWAGLEFLLRFAVFFSHFRCPNFSKILSRYSGMLALVLHNLENNPDANSSAVFSDVANGVWYEAAVSWAAERSIISGYGNGLFGPGDNITREQLAVILWRYTGMPTASGSSLAGFTDASTASTYALDALEWAVKSGIISGNGSGILDPKGFATRAQVAQIFMNYLMR